MEDPEQVILDCLEERCVSAALYPKLLYALSEVYPHQMTTKQHAAIHRLIAWIEAVAENDKSG